MNRLLAIGFEPAGHWLPQADGIVCELSRHSSQRNILYAFVSDGEVKYVGKTVQSLQARMGGYRNPAPSQTTNLKGNARIKALLHSGAAVDILALPDNGLFHYGQFHINLAAGLEDSIIRLLKPEWNGDAVNGEREPQEAESPPVPQPTPASHSFPLVLHKTYFERGFFNVGVEHSDQFGGDRETIEIFCGRNSEPILGFINRTANVNGTPRIMGGVDLRDWFQTRAHEMEQVTITVMASTAIRVEALVAPAV